MSSVETGERPLPVVALARRPAVGINAVLAAYNRGASREPAHAMADPVHHILLVEDSEDDALLICAELRKMNRPFEFRRVDSRDDMRAALAERSWDLVISDHQMPGFDSLQAFEELRGSGQDAPIIIMSGTLPEHNGADAMLHGASDFIDKSNRARLLPVVARELRNAGMRRAKEAVERTLVHMTSHDTLTGLPNRLMLTRLIEHHVASRTQPGQHSGLLVLELDRFVRVTESVGHAGGEDLLKQVAARLAETAPQSVVARIGQDTFALYIDEVVDGVELRSLAEAVNAMLSRAFTVGGQALFVHASIGVCIYPEEASSSAELIANAEHAKFDAKGVGSGAIVNYARPARPADLFADPLRLESALREALARQEFFLVYQPLIDVASGRMVGTEALVRWRHPEHGVVLPIAFIPLAEEIGLIGDLGAWVLATACRQTRAWHEAGMTAMTVAVNVSAVQFRAGGFVALVRKTLDEAKLDARYLELELVESELMEDVEATIRMLQELKALGVRLSIDDFGTGYSSLSYLTRLPIDVLKIDKTFLHGIADVDQNRAIAGTIVALAKCLQMSVVAEGVETPAQLDFVRGLKCERVQGYLLARPLEAAAVARFATAGDNL